MPYQLKPGTPIIDRLLSNVGRKYKTPRILEDRVRPRGYPGELCQIAVTDLGHDKPTLLITNQLDERPADLIDRYARRMAVGNGISAAVPMKIDVDLNLTVLAERIDQEHQRQMAATLFQKFVKASAEISIGEREIVVGFGRRSYNRCWSRPELARTAAGSPGLETGPSGSGSAKTAARMSREVHPWKLRLEDWGDTTSVHQYTRAHSPGFAEITVGTHRSFLFCIAAVAQ